MQRTKINDYSAQYVNNQTYLLCLLSPVPPHACTASFLRRGLLFDLQANRETAAHFTATPRNRAQPQQHDAALPTLPRFPHRVQNAFRVFRTRIPENGGNLYNIMMGLPTGLSTASSWTRTKIMINRPTEFCPTRKAGGAKCLETFPVRARPGHASLTQGPLAARILAGRLPF